MSFYYPKFMKSTLSLVCFIVLKLIFLTTQLTIDRIGANVNGGEKNI